MARRLRLDKLVVERGLADSRQQARTLILSGQIRVDGIPRDKPAAQVSPGVHVTLEGPGLAYVSRGGHKLAHGLDHFQVDPAGRVCADLGASTGGFTDCLLQRAAARVFAIDVGYGQLDWKLRSDPRVVVMERTNARHLDGLPQPPELVVGDLSFISLRLILPAIQRIAGAHTDAVLLIKPQFEAGREGLKRGGLVRDEATRTAAIKRVVDDARAQGFTVLGTVPSPIAGARSGNVEELVHLRTPGV
jgi:23S rRNA (cytidine1920-2'-O)/16S rRNA (cytidine1409-2'-O)-methyltransferase